MARSSRQPGEVILLGATVGAPGGRRHGDSEFRPKSRPICRATWLLLSLLATSALTPILSARPALAEDCAAAAPPSDVASPTTLYDRLRGSTDADFLAIEFGRKRIAKACASIYQVKMLTVSGAVVELDFAATDLNLVGARGPLDDRSTIDLLRSLGADPALLKQRDEDEEQDRSSETTSRKQDGNASGSGSDSGGSSGSGSGDSDNEGGSDGSGGSSGGGSSGGGSGSGGSGGSGDSDGGDSDGGDSDGGDSDGGDSGGSEGGEGGSD